MSRSVDHAKRRKEILVNALELFSTAGYPNVTYKLVASHCGLSRTVLYRYFKTKREIFENVIELVTKDLATAIATEITVHSQTSCAERLTSVMMSAIELLGRHTPFLQVINEYLIGLRREGEDVSKRVRRHTILVHRAITNLVRDGVAAGEFTPVQCSVAGDLLYGMLESAAFRLAISDTADMNELRRSVRLTVNHLVKK